ncbi:MAG: CoA transferase, partial [Alphaproteobacteria bacterium]|nr:CoA transferase [Alphaproteobacteria bacterium]
RIDLALFDVALAMLANQASNYLVSGQVPGRIGNTHPTIVPYQLFQTADNPFVLAVGNDGQFRKFCDVTGTPELGRDPRYATNKERVKHRDQLTAILAPIFRARTAQAWFELLAPEGIPCSPVLSIGEALAHKQAINRGAVGAYEHAVGVVKHITSPVHGLAGKTSAPPQLGADTENVLRDILGFAPADVALLRASGAIA